MSKSYYYTCKQCGVAAPAFRGPRRKALAASAIIGGFKKISRYFYCKTCAKAAEKRLALEKDKQEHARPISSSD